MDPITTLRLLSPHGTLWQAPPGSCSFHRHSNSMHCRHQRFTPGSFSSTSSALFDTDQSIS
jgi:hypothetical protein